MKKRDAVFWMLFSIWWLLLAGIATQYTDSKPFLAIAMSIGALAMSAWSQGSEDA